MALTAWLRSMGTGAASAAWPSRRTGVSPLAHGAIPRRSGVQTARSASQRSMGTGTMYAAWHSRRRGPSPSVQTTRPRSPGAPTALMGSVQQMLRHASRRAGRRCCGALSQQPERHSERTCCSSPGHLRGARSAERTVTRVSVDCFARALGLSLGGARAAGPPPCGSCAVAATQSRWRRCPVPYL